MTTADPHRPTSGEHVRKTLRAVTAVMQASFHAMAVCDHAGRPLVRNPAYRTLEADVGGTEMADLVRAAIEQPHLSAHHHHVVPPVAAEVVRCQAGALRATGAGRLFVVTCRRERAAVGQLSAEAVRSVRENLALALEVLEREAVEAEAPQPSRPLTAIERRVYLALVSGYRVSSIARELHVSESTVRSHLRSIFAKYDVHSQAELFDKVLAHKRMPLGQ